MWREKKANPLVNILIVLRYDFDYLLPVSIAISALIFSLFSGFYLVFMEQSTFFFCTFSHKHDAYISQTACFLNNVNEWWIEFPTLTQEHRWPFSHCWHCENWGWWREERVVAPFSASDAGRKDEEGKGKNFRIFPSTEHRSRFVFAFNESDVRRRQNKQSQLS